MKKNKTAETLVMIMVSVIIITFIAVGLVGVLNLNSNITNSYKTDVDYLIVKANAKNIAKKISNNIISPGEEFYIFKDKSSKKYKIFTGITQQKYKNIDNLGNYIDLGNTSKTKIFSRTFKKGNNSVIDENNIFVEIK